VGPYGGSPKYRNLKLLVLVIDRLPSYLAGIWHSYNFYLPGLASQARDNVPYKDRSHDLGRRFLPWQKKRGHRRTGSQVAGSVGEGLMFAALLLSGSFALIALLTSRIIEIPGVSTLTTGSGLWLSVLVLASLILIGAGGLVWTVLQAGTSAERRNAIASRAADIDLLSNRLPEARDYPAIPRNENLVNSPGVRLTHRLPCSTSSTWSLLALAFLCLICNGLVASFAVVLFKSFVASQPQWLFLVVLLPLTLIAARLTWHFLHRLRETVRIGPTSVEVSDVPFYPGRRYDLCLVQHGRMSLKSLKLMLACDEFATYREGTDVRIERRRVSLQKVLKCSSVDVRTGTPFVHQGELVMPEQIMHSFRASSNSIQWKLLVQGELQKGGRFEREFPIVVYPNAVEVDRG